MEIRRLMVCINCGMKIHATLRQAKFHGWALWVGGSRCKACCESRGTEPEWREFALDARGTGERRGG